MSKTMTPMGKKLLGITELASQSVVDVPLLMQQVSEAILLEREECAQIAENVRGGFTANIRISPEEQEMLRDKDGPWVLNSDVAAAIRRRGTDERCWLRRNPSQSFPVERDFIALYARVVEKAKELLEIDNRTCGDNWPAGQAWEVLSGTSKSIFMERARKELGVNSGDFMAVIRKWPPGWSAEGFQKIERLFGE